MLRLYLNIWEWECIEGYFLSGRLQSVAQVVDATTEELKNNDYNWFDACNAKPVLESVMSKIVGQNNFKVAKQICIIFAKPNFLSLSIIQKSGIKYSSEVFRF